MSIKNLLKENKPLIDKTIEKWIPREYTEKELAYSGLSNCDIEAINESIADPFWELLDRGGKRWRPTLLLLTCEALGGKPSMDFAIIPEVIHTGCVTGETLIIDGEGVPKKITDFKEGQDVLSLNFEGNIEKQRIVKTHKNGVSEVFKVKTNNREIIATKNHPFLVISKEQPTRMRLTKQGKRALNKKLLEMGTNVFQFSKRIYPSLKGNNFSLRHMENVLYGCKHCLLPTSAVTSIVAELGMSIENNWEKVKCKYQKAEVNLKWKELKNLKKGDLIVITKELPLNKGVVPKIPKVTQNCKDRNKIPEKFSIEFAQFLGFFLGDGSISNGKVDLSLPEKMGGRKQYAQLVEKLFKAKPLLYTDTITICSKAISEIISNLGFNKHALTKKIPDWIFKLPRSYKLAFIRGYLDSDGTVAKNGQVTFECANKQVIIKLKALLDTLGFTTSNIHIRTVDNQHFKRHVRKKETTLYGMSLYSKNRVLKEIGSEIKEYKRRLGKKAQRSVTFRLEEAVPTFPKNMSRKEIGFNRVKDIEYVGKRNTYDLQIEKTHNYISNGIITHNTIIIDDIEDNSTLRRGEPCLHSIFGTDIAINVGNVLYYLPLLVLLKNKENLTKETLLKAYEIYAQEMINISFGQAMDLTWHRGKNNVTEEQYLQMCAYKTGTLARMSAKFGALLAGANDSVIEKMGRFAESIGVAFQIQDDLLNLKEGEFAEGKGFGEDIHEGKRSLMVIYTLKKANDSDRKRLIELLDKHTNNQLEIREAIAILKKYDSFSYAQEIAKNKVKSSWKEVDKILPPSDAKEKLREFANYLIEREI